MAVDILLHIDTVPGESRISGHEDEIDILSWNWGMSQAGSFHTGNGGGSGKVNVQDIVLTKYVDKSTPTLINKCANGTHIPSATLTLRKAGDPAVDYLVIKFDKLMVSSVSTGSAAGDDRLIETITLHFAKFSVVYTPQDNDGAGIATSEFAFDVEANVPA